MHKKSVRRPRNAAPEVCAQPARTSLLTHVQRRAVTHRLVMKCLNIAHYAPPAQPMQLEACGRCATCEMPDPPCGSVRSPCGVTQSRCSSGKQCSGCRSEIAVQQHPQHPRSAALAPMHRFADEITCSCSVTAASTKHRRAAWGPCVLKRACDAEGWCARTAKCTSGASHKALCSNPRSI